MNNWNMANINRQQNDTMIHFINAHDDMNCHKRNAAKESNIISLLDSSNYFTILKNMPRTFEISTNNGSCYFNTMLIQEIYTISNLLQRNQNGDKYHLPIDNNAGSLFFK